MRVLNLYRFSHKQTNGILYRFTTTKQKKIDPSQIPFDLQPMVKQQKISQLLQIRNAEKKSPLDLRSKPGKLSEKLKQKLKKKEDEKLSLTNQSNITTTYYQNQKQRIKNNLRTRNFYTSEYAKGQMGLQNAPLDPYYQYKISDYKKRMEQMQQEIRDFKIIQYNNIERSESLQSTADGYDQKLKKYEYERFVKKIQQYPGSIKGSTPEQDPENYRKYLWQNIPKFMKDKVRHEQYRQSEVNPRLRRELKRDDDRTKPSYVLGNSLLAHNNNLQIPEVEPSMVNVNFILPYYQIPLLPTTKFVEYQDYMLKIFAWSRFRNSYYAIHFIDNLKKSFDLVSEIARNEDGQQYYEIKPAASSLSRYYHTLPKFLQDDPGVKNSYIGLQYSCPELSMQKKEDMLNQAAMYSLPLDSVSTLMMDKALQKRKMHLTPQLKNKLFTMPAQYTWQMKKFLAEVKQQKLRSASNIQQSNQEYKTPPQVWKRHVTDVPQLPVDYYDNDDGFWTAHISRKLARYDKAKPLGKFRKQFTH